MRAAAASARGAAARACAPRRPPSLSAAALFWQRRGPACSRWRLPRPAVSMKARPQRAPAAARTSGGSPPRRRGAGPPPPFPASLAPPDSARALACSRPPAARGPRPSLLLLRHSSPAARRARGVPRRAGRGARRESAAWLPRYRGSIGCPEAAMLQSSASSASSTPTGYGAAARPQLRAANRRLARAPLAARIPLGGS